MPLTLRPLPKGRDDRPLIRPSKPQWRFDDLVLDRVTSELLNDIADENLNRTLLASNGLHPRQRLLLVGASGTGKSASASAHALAAELSLPVATASLAALTSSFLDETARNVEAVVHFADVTPCVLLLDEFDVLAQERASAGDHDEIRRVVATVLQLLEQGRGESLVIATSNHPGLLDSAVWRRFDEVVPFPRPDLAQIARLIELKLRAVEHEIASKIWARRLSKASQAEIEMVCTDALRRAVLTGAGHVTDVEMTQAASRLTARRAGMAQVVQEPDSAKDSRPDDIKQP